MSWTNPDPVEQEAWRRLTSTGWRVLHSLWLLVPIFSCGLLTWAGFVYIGVRTRRATWWVPGILYGAAMVTVFVLLEVGDDARAEEFTALEDAGMTVWVSLWLAGIVHGLIANHRWLNWQARYPWNVYGTAVPPPLPPGARPGPLPGVGYAVPGQPTAPQPDRQPAGTWTPSTGPSTGPSSGEDVLSAEVQVDVNTADATELAVLPGFDGHRIDRVLSTRTSRGGFASVEEFGRAAELPPHEFLRLRPHLSCSPGRGAAPPSGSGRVLDI
ncbi:MAG: helix-hairpin-helix domain-containing protein [Actinomycetales bacterium]|mgnify:CR=1 FL=1|nr:helix-hairpin-helix domain-containing protein [Actinomycetales bacterium]